MYSDSEILSTIRRGFSTSKCRIDRKCSCGNILIFPYMNEQWEWVGHNYKLWNVPCDGWTRGVTRGCCVTSTFPRRVSRCEIRENIENDMIKVSPLPAESTRLLYGGGRGMDRATRVERNGSIANLQEVRFGLSMWIIHTITTGRIALVFFVLLSRIGRNRETHIVTIPGGSLSFRTSSSRKVDSILALNGSPRPNWLLLQFFLDLFDSADARARKNSFNGTSFFPEQHFQRTHSPYLHFLLTMHSRMNFHSFDESWEIQYHLIFAWRIIIHNIILSYQFNI